MQVELLSELKSTLADRLFHTLTTWSLKNVSHTYVELLTHYELLCNSVQFFLCEMCNVRCEGCEYCTANIYLHKR